MLVYPQDFHTQETWSLYVAMVTNGQAREQFPVSVMHECVRFDISASQILPFKNSDCGPHQEGDQYDGHAIQERGDEIRTL